jgi:MFS family permease
MLKLPSALRYRKYALFWTGLIISVAGSQMQVWSIFWHIRLLTDQPIAVSGIGVARFLPILAFSLFGGLVADTFDRRKVMLITQVALTLVAAVLGLITLGGHMQVWMIYLLTGVQAVATSFDLPARQSLVPNLLPREELPNAFSLQSIAFNAGSIAGPALSGLVISTLGLSWVYFINAASYLVLIAMLVAIGDVPQTSNGMQSARTPGDVFAAIGEGIRYILKTPVILSSMILDFFATFFSSANTLLPFVAQDVLHVGVVQYGWLSAGQSIGAVSVGLFFSQHSRIRRQGALLLGAVVVFGLATVVFGLGRSFWIVLLALAIIGAADSVSTILRNTIRQIQTPDAIRGRMVSINQIFFAGGPQLGEIEAGLVAQAFSIPAAIITGGVGCILAALAITGFWPQLARYNGDEPPPENKLVKAA